MTTLIVCIPVSDDGQVGPAWGKARTVALASVEDGAITSWRTEEVNWHISHDEGTEGSHHARVARFVRSNEITVVVARHMGAGMRTMLAKLGVSVHLGAAGDAQDAVTSLSVG